MCSKKIDWASGRFLQMFVAFSEYPNTYRAARVPLQRTITLACSNRKFIKISYTVSGACLIWSARSIMFNAPSVHG